MSAVRSCSNPVCGNTESKPGEFKQCSRCKSAYYCSKECQITHWKKGHKEECKPVANANQSMISSAETSKAPTNEQEMLLRKECQTMYNNYEIAQGDVKKLNVDLKTKQIVQEKIKEMDNSKDVYCAYGSMYMQQSYKEAENSINARVQSIESQIETASKQSTYFEKKYKELEANLKEL